MYVELPNLGNLAQTYMFVVDSQTVFLWNYFDCKETQALHELDLRQSQDIIHVLFFVYKGFLGPLMTPILGSKKIQISEISEILYLYNID